MVVSELEKRQASLVELQARLDACRHCPKMIGPVVHGGPVVSPVMLIGQAPGPHEGEFGKPFAWTAGKTLFRWLESSLGVGEELFRERVYMAAMARCFPGKAKGGGDRKPDPDEIARCREFLLAELELLEPALLIPVGTLAIEQVLGRKVPLAEVVGQVLPVEFGGRKVEAICLPHPSGASTWFKVEPGLGLLRRALTLLGAHPEAKALFSGAQSSARNSSATAASRRRAKGTRPGRGTESTT